MDIYPELYARLRRKQLHPLHAAAEAAKRTLGIRLCQPAARVLRVEEWNAAALGSSDPRPIAIFAHHTADEFVPAGRLRYLDALREFCSAIIFVSTTEPLNVRGLDVLKGHADLAIVRTNIGYDFGSWKVGLTHAGEAVAKGVVFANDSVFGPCTDLAVIAAEMTARPVDVWGMTDSHEIEPHLQSYFFAVSGETAVAPWFRDFWSRVVHIPCAEKYLIVRLYEVGFSAAAREAGCRIGARWETAPLAARYPERTRGELLTAINPTTAFWRELVTNESFPFLKKGMLRPENRAAFDAADIEEFIAEHFAAESSPSR